MVSSAERNAESVLARRVAARFHIREEATRALAASSRIRTASDREGLRRMLVAMAEGALLPEVGLPREAGLGAVFSKFKQVLRSIDRAPALWGKVKDLLGVESLASLPQRLKEAAREGGKYLQKALDRAFHTWPLKLYTLPEAKLFGLNALLEKLLDLSPTFKKFLRENVKPRIDQLDDWLKKNLPNLSRAVMVAIYIWIWFNVVEFEWDLKTLVSVAMGAMSLSDLLSSLPASILGFALNGLGLGTFTLLPAAMAARFAFLVGMRYVSFEGGNLRLNREKLIEDFGIPPEAFA